MPINSLKISEQRVKLMFEQALMGAILFDDDGIVLEWNRAAENIFGFTASEIIGKHFDMILTERSRPQVDKIWANLIKNRGGTHAVNENLRKDGTTIVCEWFNVTLLDPAGNAVGVSSMVHDVTERHRAEAKLRDSEEQYRLLFDHHPQPLWVFDLESHRFLAVNNAAVLKYGWSHEEFLAMRLDDVRPPSALPELERAKRETAVDGYAGRFTHWNKEHQIFVSDVYSHVMNYFGRPARLAMSIDVTKQVEYEAALQRDAMILSNVRDSVIVMDVDGTVVYWNQGAEILFGNTAKEMVGKPISSRVPLSGRPASDRLMQNLLAGQEFVGEWKSQRANGEEIWVDARVSPLTDENGVITGLLGLAYDASERKAVEQERLEINQRLEREVQERTSELRHALDELESFSYSVSHDLRAPLRALSGYSHILDEDYGSRLPDDAREMLKRINDRSTQLGQMIDGLLQISRMGRREMVLQNVDMASLVQDVLHDISGMVDGKRTQLEIKEILPCQGDSALLRQVWANLISNAFKYSSRKENPCVTLASVRVGNAIIYSVSDNGIGFDSASSERIFEVFNRMHPREFEGTGIGLAVAKRIVDRHGGRIWAESKINEGATFYFELQAANE